MKKLLLSVVLLSAGAVFSQSWVEQNTGFFAASRGIGEIKIVDANTVWALAYDGSGAGEVVSEFTKTTDGGTTWTPGTIDVGDPSQEINNLEPISADIAFISTVNPTDGLGGVYKTEDGGMTWNPSVPEAFQTVGATLVSFCNWVHFFDENTGIALGDPIGTGVGEFEIWRTTDQGVSWTQLGAELPNPLSGEYGYNGGNVGAGNRFWYVTNRGKLLRTSDQGATWEKLNTPITDFGATNVNGRLIFSDENTGLILATSNGGTSYNIYRTFDGGNTWSAPSAFTGGYNRVLTYIPGTTTIVATGAQTTAPAVPGSAYSSDNGETWTTIDTGEQRGAVAFFDGSTGWSGGFNVDETTGGIFKFVGALSVGDVATNGKLTAVPNPTNGIMQISNTNSALTQVTVFDLLGKQVYNKDFSALNNVEVNLSSLPTGAYILRAKDASGAMQTLQIMRN